jgi:hypothetical protein
MPPSVVQRALRKQRSGKAGKDAYAALGAHLKQQRQSAGLSLRAMAARLEERPGYSAAFPRHRPGHRRRRPHQRIRSRHPSQPLRPARCPQRQAETAEQGADRPPPAGLCPHPADHPGQPAPEAATRSRHRRHPHRNPTPRSTDPIVHAAAGPKQTPLHPDARCRPTPARREHLRRGALVSPARQSRYGAEAVGRS